MAVQIREFFVHKFSTILFLHSYKIAGHFQVEVSVICVVKYILAKSYFDSRTLPRGQQLALSPARPEKCRLSK